MISFAVAIGYFLIGESHMIAFNMKAMILETKIRFHVPLLIQKLVNKVLVQLS